jgi:gamma-glutamylcysteine synthetase
VEDMNKPFEVFIEKHEKKIGVVGLAKIVPPASWSPRMSDLGYENEPDMTIERCIKQVGEYVKTFDANRVRLVKVICAIAGCDRQQRPVQVLTCRTETHVT